MALAWDTDELLEAIRDDARISDDEPDATDAILLRRATSILHEVYVPKIRKVRGDYYVIEADIALEEDRASYAIPRRAATASVRRVRLVDSAGKEHPLALIAFADIHRNTTSSRPTHYAIADDRIVVYPLPSSAAEDYSLRVAFEYRPSKLVSTASTYPIFIYSIPGGALGVDYHRVSIAAAAPFTTGDVIDIVHADPPFSCPVMDVTVTQTNIGNDVLRLDSGIFSPDPTLAVAAGDLVCYAGESSIPQIPPELHPVLAKHTAAAWLAPIDIEHSNSLRGAADDSLRDLLGAMEPRKQGTQIKAKPRHSMLRGGRRRGGGGPIFGDWS